MRLLLDTHTFIWSVSNPTALSAHSDALIRDPSNEVWLSLASAWEMSIKSSTGKLQLAKPVSLFVSENAQRTNIQILAVSLEHIARVEHLPFRHRDPFDRLLVSQSLSENLPLVSIDGILDAYGIQRVW